MKKTFAYHRLNSISPPLPFSYFYSMSGKVAAETPKKRSNGLRKLTLIVPVVALAVFRVLDKGDFTPYSCALTGLNCPVPAVSGYVAPEFASVQSLFLGNIANGDDVGAGVSVYVDGELKIDLYGGYADVERQIPYTNDTLQMVFSCTKAMVRREIPSGQQEQMVVCVSIRGKI
jgi:hypothetical protein